MSVAKAFSKLQWEATKIKSPISMNFQPLNTFWLSHIKERCKVKHHQN